MPSIQPTNRPSTAAPPAPAWRRTLVYSTLVNLLFAASANPNAAAAADASLPNIIFILADDLGYGGLGCYGQELIKTPRLDQMAAEGLRFTNAYAGATVCAPSRCVLMTGLHVGHARIRGNADASRRGTSLAASDATLPKAMKAAGYATGAIGKWGLGDVKNPDAGMPLQQGLDYFFGYLRHGQAHNYYPAQLWRNDGPVKLKNGPPQNGVATKKVEYSHDLFAEEALNFVREHKDEPFFLYLAFTIPHCNNEAGDKGMEVPDYGQYAKLDWPEPQKGHAAMMSRMDADVGRLLDLLGELGINERTLVIFASDNGPPQNEGGFDPEFFQARGPLRGYKGNLTEGGIRVPLIARWPGRIAAGATTDAPVYFADVMPTLAALAGSAAPAGLDGLDFSPTLLGGEQPELADRFFYWEWNRDGLRSQASRWRNWKAIRNPADGAIELYDLANDIGETRDLAAKHPEIVDKFVKYFQTARTDSPEWPVALAGGSAR